MTTAAATAVQIYHLLDGPLLGDRQLIGRIALDRSGNAVVTVLIEQARSRLNAIAGGLVSKTLGRPVMTDEGELYIQTLRETFAVSVQWRIVEDSQ